MTPRLTLVIRPQARDDIAEAASWYEERVVGLGARFLASVDAGLRTAQQAPERFRQV